jgi:actin
MSNVICLDNGSMYLKAGFGGEDKPRVVLPNTIGTTKHASVLVGTGNKRNYIGQEAIARRGTLHLEQPMEHGNVRDWDKMEEVWRYMYLNELKVSPEDHPVLMTFNMSNMTNNVNTVATFFETFNVPAMYIGVQSLFSLYGSGRVSGLVVDVGDGVTTTIPFYEGEYLKHAKNRVDLGGRDVTNYLATMLKFRGAHMDSVTELELVRMIKEQFCFVSTDYKEELQKVEDSSVHEMNHVLPDGTHVTLNEERFKAPEILFDPAMVGMECDGVQENAFMSIRRAAIDVRKTLYENIIIVGGSTLTEGFETRLQKEIVLKAPGNMKVNVIAPPQREMTQWLGMSIYAALNGLSNRSTWLTKDDYNEYGPENLVDERIEK